MLTTPRQANTSACRTGSGSRSRSRRTRRATGFILVKAAGSRCPRQSLGRPQRSLRNSLPRGRRSRRFPFPPYRRMEAGLLPGRPRKAGRRRSRNRNCAWKTLRKTRTPTFPNSPARSAMPRTSSATPLVRSWALPGGWGTSSCTRAKPSTTWATWYWATRRRAQNGSTLRKRPANMKSMPTPSTRWWRTATGAWTRRRKPSGRIRRALP